MGAFLLRRGLQAVATILLATVVVHVAVTVLPGDPVRALFGFRPPPPEAVEAIRARYHLDEPYVVQYGLFLRDVLTLDLGHSIRGGSVNSLVAATWAPTAWLLGLAMVIQAILGVGAGVISTLRPSTWMSRSILVSASIMIAVPVVLSAPALHYLLTIRHQVLPINGVVGGWHAFVLPVATLAAVTLGTVIIFLRAELRQAMRAPFVKFAMASGVRQHRVVGVHALRAAMPPVISYLASNLGLVVVGVLIVEATMRVDGMGGLLFGAIRAQDRSVVVSVVMLITIVVILLNLLADVLVAVLDPRTRVAAREDEA